MYASSQRGTTADSVAAAHAIRNHHNSVATVKQLSRNYKKFKIVVQRMSRVMMKMRKLPVIVNPSSNLLKMITIARLPGSFSASMVLIF